MGFFTPIRKWLARALSDSDDFYFGGFFEQSAAGVRVSQQTALSATAVLACVSLLAEDVAKITPRIYKRNPDGSRALARNHFLHTLLRKPNDWQSGFDFRETMMLSLVLRGNAYAVIIRNRAGWPIKFVPVNADWVALWEAPGGELYYRITPIGLHMMAELDGQPFLIPAEDVLHIRGMSLYGLLGASKLSLVKEAIGLAMAQEQQAARYMANGAKPSGILQTDQRLNDDSAKRMKQSWIDANTGIQNAGKVAILEQGLQWKQMQLSSSDMEFLASRQFQVEEIARAFRVPLHMIGSLQKGGNNNISQQAQEYANLTLTGYTERWSSKLDSHFDLADDDLEIDWDYTVLTSADILTRYNGYRIGIMSGFMKPNEARLREGYDPDPEGDKLLQPVNMADMGTASAGTPADDAGASGGDAKASGGIPT